MVRIEGEIPSLVVVDVVESVPYDYMALYFLGSLQYNTQTCGELESAFEVLLLNGIERVSGFEVEEESRRFGAERGAEYGADRHESIAGAESPVQSHGHAKNLYGGIGVPEVDIEVDSGEVMPCEVDR